MSLPKRVSRPLPRKRPSGISIDPLSQVAERLGGSQVWKKTPASMLEVHEAIERGFPSKSVRIVISNTKGISSKKLLKVFHISQRTVQRYGAAPDKPLNKEQSGRLWKFAEILNKASAVLGSEEAAERWLSSPAVALEQRLPMDLLTTQAGAEIVEQLLGRLEHGVYT
jgi:putative toxin-antitoxin system antitoxin component (TIGR02293 family)